MSLRLSPADQLRYATDVNEADQGDWDLARLLMVAAGFENPISIAPLYIRQARWLRRNGVELTFPEGR